MKMKKMMLFAAISALALAGCSDNDSTDQGGTTPLNAIGFKSYVEKNAKGSPLEPGALKQDFGVYAYYDAVGDENLANLTPDFMFNQRVIYENPGFTYTPVKFWPNSGDVDFYAYTPYGSANLLFTTPQAATDKGYPVFTYTVGTPIASEEDLLVATKEDQDGLSGSVNLVFDHALTKVGFSARTAGDYASLGVTVKVKSISLKDIVNKGSFSYDKYTNVADTSKWWTVDQASMAAYAPAFKDNGGINVGFYEKDAYLLLNASDQFLLMIPQSFSGKTSQLTLVYDLIYADGTPTEEFTKVVDLNGTIPWTAGVYVNYAFTISLKMVTFTATVTDWRNESQSIIILPEDNE